MASSKKITTLVMIALVALAFTGCSSDDSNPAAVIIDTAPPAVPANLSMAYDSGSATISWAQNNVDSDLAGYIVTRRHSGTSTELVASPALMNSYVDSNPQPGFSQYHVYAVDTSGNQSAIASVDLMISQTHQPADMSE